MSLGDLDGDGMLDIVFTHRGIETLSYWRNSGETIYLHTPDGGIYAEKYTQN